MIVSFGDEATADLFHGRNTTRARRIPNNIHRRALQKLDQLNAVHHLQDLRVPPGNRLEALQGDLIGYYSIRINQQWRIIFRWEDGDIHDVEIVDYH